MCISTGPRFSDKPLRNSKEWVFLGCQISKIFALKLFKNLAVLNEKILVQLRFFIQHCST